MNFKVGDTVIINAPYLDGGTYHKQQGVIVIVNKHAPFPYQVELSINGVRAKILFEETEINLFSYKPLKKLEWV